MTTVDINALEAIDIHVHIDMDDHGHASLPDHLMEGAQAHFQSSGGIPKLADIAAFYRERKMAAVVFTVDSESVTGQRAISNDEIADGAAQHSDVLIPFGSIDPAKGSAAVDEARRLVTERGIRGFKLHPNLQAFFPNERSVYPFYEQIEQLNVPIIFHTGQSGVGSGLHGAGGLRLKYSNPLHIDDVAVDFPDLRIVMAHPSFPWQDEALAVAAKNPNVYIDLSGWSPKYFPPNLVQYANSLLKDRVLFGSDYPLLTPDRWIADFDKLEIKPEVRPLIMKQNAVRLLRLD
ncbi:amidohydrolase family protein [Salinibacterium sp. ZJ450]|uniref:amidohydrolase family protein n=1 Tax=Salinibacterium sp. ZJ450 TaxID=2708338 RepID=UPI00141DFC65|nr:amidohydrolase family protein [Salinibacterium sp. ZJ450]